MKGHTCIGAQIVSPTQNELDTMAQEVCLHHHDNFDGGIAGFPKDFNYMDYIPETQMPVGIEQKYRGTSIPLAARIVALADVYDALRHKRYYKEEWTLDMTIKEIKKEAGHQFDPEVVEAFVQVIDRLEAINTALS